MISYRLRVFLLLTAALVVALVGWSLWRWRARAPQRDAWERITERIAVQGTRIDSLEGSIAALEDTVAAERERLESIGERIGHYEGSAVDDRLPTPEYRRYRSAIERHNEVVERHNEDLARLHEVYDRYSALVDSQNALIDSANALQRRAAEEGFQLPEAELE
ncbi:MAG: hypothetical protein R3199_00130 [Gemmatimonadota bacterium]|nr:hypothetical protein [Gemmatimonadota bacterium]